MSCRRALGEAAEASAPALSGRDRVLEALLVDVGVDRGGADVGVSGELADDLDRLAGVGEMCAERVAQDVWGASIVGQSSSLRVVSDDPGDVAHGERAGAAAGPGERDEQLVVRASWSSHAPRR